LPQAVELNDTSGRAALLI